MLLTGTFERTLDDKFRFTFPKRLRDLLQNKANTLLYLAPGTDGSLALYPEESFQQIAKQLDHGSPTGRDVRAFSRMFYTQAQHCEFDRQGRVRIPPELVRFAALSREIILLGVRDRLEIWDRARWEQYYKAIQADYDLIAENAFSLGQEKPIAEVTDQQTKTQEAEPPRQPR